MNDTDLFFFLITFLCYFLFYNAIKIFEFLFDSATQLRVLSYGVFFYEFTAGVSIVHMKDPNL